MDPDGFDPEADTVGAGIYGGKIKCDAEGNPVIGKQYENHNPLPGPVYTGEGYTDISKAISRGDKDKIRSLIEADKSLINKVMTGGATPLHMAGMSKNGETTAELLIELGGDIHAEDTWGYKPIHRMASNNLDIGLEALLKAGADIRAVTPRLSFFPGCETPLSIAVQSRAFRVIKKLLAYGITPEELAKFGIRKKN